MKNKKQPYLGVMVAAAFASFICGVTIDSAFADKNELNTLFTWATVLFGVVAIGALIGAARTPKE